MYRACIFDLDGTLTDTLESLTFSVNETMKEIGFPGITRDQCRKFVGNGAKVLIEKALEAGGDSGHVHFDEAFSVYKRIFDANCTYKVEPYKGMPAILDRMRQHGIQLGVLSNKPHRQAVHVVDEIFGRDMFDQVQGQREGVPRKPNPAALLSMARFFGVRPEETLYIGDSEVDAATGKAARMDTILVSWGFRSLEVLKDAAPDWIVDSPAQILEIAEKSQQEEVGNDTDEKWEES